MMEWLWRLLIIGCMCHFQSRPCAFGAKMAGTPRQCKKAEFVPGHNLAGEGFDIVTMQQKGAYVVNLERWSRGNGSCTLVKNPYLPGNRWQKIPADVVGWRAYSSSQMKVVSKKYESSESLVKDSTSSVESSWKIGLSIPFTASISFGGTHSREASFAMAKSKADKYSFVSQEISSNLYRYRLVSQPPLHEEFAKAISALPKAYSPSAYVDLIATYGTHFMVSVQLGGRLRDITAIKTCKAALKGLTVTEVMDCLEVEASATFKSVTLQAEARHCQKDRKSLGTSQRFSSMFAERTSSTVGGDHGGNLLFSRNSWAQKKWMNSLKTKPGIVHYTLRPLSFLLSPNDPARARLNRAISSYIKKNALVKRCSGSCQAGRRGSARDRCACVCQGNSQITADCCPARPGLAMLRVYGLYARKLYGDVMTQTDGSVLVRYGGRTARTRIIPNNDNPNWPDVFNFNKIEINMATRLKFTVYDEDRRWDSDLLGSCSTGIRRGVGSGTCMFKYGTFFYSYSVRCAPSLGGDKCQDYVPSRMSRSLANSFHSRNGFLAGDRWEALLAGNHSEFAGHGPEIEDHLGE